MKKRNALLLALLGSLSIVSSIALIATWWSKPADTAESAVHRYSEYSEAQAPKVEAPEKAQTPRQKKEKELRDQGYSEAEIQAMMKEWESIEY